MGQTFDPKAHYGEVFGTSEAKYFQNGRYFDGAGRELTKRDENGEFVPNEALVAQHAPSAPDDDADAAASADETGASGTDESEQPDGEDDEPADVAAYLEKLKGMTAFEVKSIFVQAGGDPELANGEGAKQRMIDWLAQQLDDSQ